MVVVAPEVARADTEAMGAMAINTDYDFTFV
jgi:hypothetical protein